MESIKQGELAPILTYLWKLKQIFYVDQNVKVVSIPGYLIATELYVEGVDMVVLHRMGQSSKLYKVNKELKKFCHPDMMYVI